MALTPKQQHDKNQKNLQIQQLSRCCDDPSIHISIECSICGESYNAFFAEGEYENFEEAVAKEVYAEGWRYTTSDAFGLIGPICEVCIEDKDNPEAHE